MNIGKVTLVLLTVLNCTAIVASEATKDQDVIVVTKEVHNDPIAFLTTVKNGTASIYTVGNVNILKAFADRIASMSNPSSKHSDTEFKKAKQEALSTLLNTIKRMTPASTASTLNSQQSRTTSTSSVSSSTATSRTPSSKQYDTTKEQKVNSEDDTESEHEDDEGFIYEENRPFRKKLSEGERARLFEGQPLTRKLRFNETPLMLAANQGDIPLMEKILSMDKKSIHVKDNIGRTALFYAISANHAQAVSLLLKESAQVNAKDNDHETALMLAIKYGYTKIIEILLQKKANINAQDKTGQTPLLHAINANDPAVVKLILQYNPNLDLGTDVYSSVLDAAYYAYKDRALARHSEKQTDKEIKQLNEEIIAMLENHICGLQDLVTQQEQKKQKKQDKKIQKKEALRKHNEQVKAQQIIQNAAEEKARAEQETKRKVENQAFKVRQQAREKQKQAEKKKQREMKQAQEQKLEAELNPKADNFYNSKLGHKAFQAMKTTLKNRRKAIAQHVFDAWKTLKERNSLRDTLYAQAFEHSVACNIADRWHRKKVLSQCIGNWLLAKQGKQIIQATETENQPIGSQNGNKNFSNRQLFSNSYANISL